MRTNIVIFLIVNILVFFLFSCDTTENPNNNIPNIRVNFSINILNTPALQTPLNPQYIKSANGENVGYLEHGIYLIKINGGEFKAFDASCTFQSNTESHPDIKEHLEQLEENPVLVRCPRCNSQFNLLTGAVQSGRAQYPLKNYRTTISGNILRVVN